MKPATRYVFERIFAHETTAKEFLKCLDVKASIPIDDLSFEDARKIGWSIVWEAFLREGEEENA